MLNIIKAYNFKIILTSFPDFRFESLKPFSNDKIKYVENSISLLSELSKNIKENEVIIVTGSLHFIGYIINNFN